jgi:hypothetical protein
MMFANRENVETGRVCKLRSRQDLRQALPGADRVARPRFRHEVAERIEPQLECRIHRIAASLLIAEYSICRELAFEPPRRLLEYSQQRYDLHQPADDLMNCVGALQQFLPLFADATGEQKDENHERRYDRIRPD